MAGVKCAVDSWRTGTILCYSDDTLSHRRASSATAAGRVRALEALPLPAVTGSSKEGDTAAEHVGGTGWRALSRPRRMHSAVRGSVPLSHEALNLPTDGAPLRSSPGSRGKYPHRMGTCPAPDGSEHGTGRLVRQL